MELANYNKENDREYMMQEEFIQDLSTKLYKERIKKGYFEIVFLCIGTDKITGDCFGPLVGSKLNKLLEKYNIFNINIYGTLKNNICYTNIEQTLKEIKNKHSKACIVVIDAALSKKENIGKIFITNEKTILGKGLNKGKIETGDISIKAVVGKNYKMPIYNFEILQNISLGLVMDLSNIVSNGIFEVIKYT